MPACYICASKPGTDIWVIPDPYYGYGHFAKLCCERCDPTQTDIFYEKKGRKYDPEYDDYFLNLTKEPPLDYAWTSYTEPCWDCKQDAGGFKTGTFYFPDEIGGDGLLCTSCFRKRNGKTDDIQPTKEEAEKHSELVQKRRQELLEENNADLFRNTNKLSKLYLVR